MRTKTLVIIIEICYGLSILDYLAIIYCSVPEHTVITLTLLIKVEVWESFLAGNFSMTDNVGLSL